MPDALVCFRFLIGVFVAGWGLSLAGNAGAQQQPASRSVLAAGLPFGVHSHVDAEAVLRGPGAVRYFAVRRRVLFGALEGQPGSPLNWIELGPAPDAVALAACQDAERIYAVTPDGGLFARALASAATWTWLGATPELKRLACVPAGLRGEDRHRQTWQWSSGSASWQRAEGRLGARVLTPFRLWDAFYALATQCPRRRAALTHPVKVTLAFSQGGVQRFEAAVLGPVGSALPLRSGDAFSLCLQHAARRLAPHLGSAQDSLSGVLAPPLAFPDAVQLSMGKQQQRPELVALRLHPSYGQGLRVLAASSMDSTLSVTASHIGRGVRLYIHDLGLAAADSTSVIRVRTNLAAAPVLEIPVVRHNLPDGVDQMEALLLASR